MVWSDCVQIRGFGWVGGRWEGFADKDVVNSGRKELLEEVVNHAQDSKDNNCDNNALDLEEPKSGWAQI